jgi:hypothetical protein
MKIPHRVLRVRETASRDTRNLARKTRRESLELVSPGRCVCCFDQTFDQSQPYPKLSGWLARYAPSSPMHVGGKMKNYKGNMGSGRSVPRSGTYGFFHVHSAQREITLLKGRVFPFCPKCSDPVEFVLLRALPAESASARFRLLMDGMTSLRQHRANAV